jgi:hypothetical protein
MKQEVDAYTKPSKRKAELFILSVSGDKQLPSNSGSGYPAFRGKPDQRLDEWLEAYDSLGCD